MLVRVKSGAVRLAVAVSGRVDVFEPVMITVGQLSRLAALSPSRAIASALTCLFPVAFFVNVCAAKFKRRRLVGGKPCALLPWLWLRAFAPAPGAFDIRPRKHIGTRRPEGGGVSRRVLPMVDAVFHRTCGWVDADRILSLYQLLR